MKSETSNPGKRKGGGDDGGGGEKQCEAKKENCVSSAF